MAKIDANKSFDLTEKEINTLIKNADEEPEDRKKVKDFIGYFIETYTDDGDFDAEKGSMVDYPICLYDADGKLVAEATGGYYNAVSGEMFNDETFYIVKPKVVKPKRKLTDLDKYLVEMSKANMTDSEKAKQLIKYLKVI